MSREIRQTRGLMEDDGSMNRLFLEVKYGSICQVAKGPTPGFEAIVVENPREKDPNDPTRNKQVTKFIKRYKGLEAYVVKIEWYDKEHQLAGGKALRFMGYKMHLNAGGIACVLDLPFKTPACRRFMLTALNLNFEEPIEFSAWLDKDKKTAFVMRQNGDPVKQYYTKDSEDLPKGEQDEVTKEWDFKKQSSFLFKMMRDRIIPHIDKVGNPAGKSPAPMQVAPAAEVHTEESFEEPTDLLPERGDEPGPSEPAEIDEDEIPF